MKNVKEKLVLRSAKLSTKEDETGKKFLVGIIPYNSKSVDFGGGNFEIISNTSFNKTLADKTEVRALFNHDDSKILGNTKSGTLELESTDDGLICSVELPNTSYANDLFEIITRGDVTTMSFGFVPVKWEYQGNTRVLKEVKLQEVSYGVTFPAYAETNTATVLRNYLKENNINYRKIEDAMKQVKPEEKTDKEEIKKLIGKLSELIGIEQPEIKEEEVKEDESLEEVEEKPEKSTDTPEEKEITSKDDSESEELQLELELEQELAKEEE